jgi:TonB family protein
MGPNAPDKLIFSPLPEWRKPWTQFGVSGVVHVVMIALVIGIGLVRPHILATPERDYHTIALVETPPVVNHAPQPLKVIPHPVEMVEPDPARPVLRLPASLPKPVVREVAAPEIKITAKTNLPKLDNVPVIPRELVRTNTFSTGSSAPQTIAKAPEQVQTGGFGDPNGVNAKPMPNRAVNIAAAGGFDMPNGAGKGNGTGGAHGAQGVVASSGFGGGVATGDGSGKVSGSRGTVQTSGFGDVAAAPTVRAQRAAPDQTPLKPAEVLSKPVPVYTEEARQLKIEGEVLLEVVLQSSGNLRVVRVVRGLGHGLDESAVRAAEKVQFKPATRNGQPTDSTAVLHVVFQLA